MHVVVPVPCVSNNLPRRFFASVLLADVSKLSVFLIVSRVRKPVFSPNQCIAAVVVIPRAAHCHLEELGITKIGVRRGESAAGVSEDSARSSSMTYKGRQLLDPRNVIGKTVVAEESLVVVMEGLGPERRSHVIQLKTTKPSSASENARHRSGRSIADAAHLRPG